MTDDIKISEEARLIYQGPSSISSYGRNSSSGQWFKVLAEDEVQFKESIKQLYGNTAVYVSIGVGDDLILDGQEFMLTAASSSARSANNFRLQCEEWDSLWYDTCKKWKAEAVGIHLVIIAGEYHSEKADPVGEHADVSIKIRQSRLFSNTDFLQFVGKEESYIKWLQKQPCVLSGSFWKNPETGEELNEAAHIREIRSGAGIATKPKYNAVPLHYKLHRWQHDHSMTELWHRNSYDKGCPKNKHYRRLDASCEYPIHSASVAAHAFFQTKARGYMSSWAQSVLMAWAGVDRLSHISQNKLDAWITSIGAEQYLGVI